MSASACPPGVTLSDLPPPPAGRSGWPWTVAPDGLPARQPGGRPWPRISIVTPSYNQGHFLEETIRSVLLQGYPNLEYLLLDGGSTDGSVAIIETYAPWLSFWRSERDGGQSAAIADGFDHAGGEILAWLNSDDCFRPDALARVGRFFDRRPNLAFACGDVAITDSAGQMTDRVYAIPPNRFLTANLGRHVWPQQGAFWRRRAYLLAGGVDRSLHFCMDRDLFLRLTAVGPSARIPGPPLGEFRQHEEAKSSTILDVARDESERLIARYASPALRKRRRLLETLWGLWYRPTGLRIRLHTRFGWEL